MRIVKWYRERARRHTDSEHHQALLRAVIVSLLLGQTAWVAARDPRAAAALWVINVSSIAFSLLLLAHILVRPAAAPVRRVVGAVHDNVAVTIWLYHCGPMGALALFVYPFVTVGNGFRYGGRYLAWSGVLGAAGLGVLIRFAPGWTTYATIGVGVLLSHVVVTVYTGALLRRLRQTQHELERMATCDVLTGLPNRRFFMEQLGHMAVAPDRRDLACLYLDLDGFKGVNDGCGHKVGDELLKQVGRRALSCLRPADLLARLGGDEFTAVLDGPAGLDAAAVVAARIIAAIEGIETVDGHAVKVSASVGIAYAAASAQATQGALADELLRGADEAMYVAKRAGKGRFRLVTLADVRLANAA
jgi:diguanylate cyclase (GGDEF)-like protein